MNNSWLMSWSTTPATDFFGQELQFHTNQYHFQAYLTFILSSITLGYREFDRWPQFLLFRQFLSYIAIIFADVIQRLYSNYLSQVGGLVTGNIFPFFLTYDHLTDRCSSCFLYILAVLLLLSALRVSGPAT